ncbi:hypothetical protein BURK1_02068 [Burkholderiales bacterium]|nr:hypothetical protein BURK1_02068 [Burkholderiales bacterium]
MMSDTLRARWNGLETRERRWLVAGTAVVVTALAFAYVWHPLVQDVPRAARDAERAQARLARAGAMASAAATRASTPAREPMEAAVRGALAGAGIAPVDATLVVSGARAALTLPSIRFAELAGLIDTLARERAVHVVDATIAARVEAGRVRAELSLSR